MSCTVKLILFHKSMYVVSFKNNIELIKNGSFLYYITIIIIKYYSYFMYKYMLFFWGVNTRNHGIFISRKSGSRWAWSVEVKITYNIPISHHLYGNSNFELLRWSYLLPRLLGKGVSSLVFNKDKYRHPLLMRSCHRD